MSLTTPLIIRSNQLVGSSLFRPVTILWRSFKCRDVSTKSMILVRLLNSPIRVGFSSSAVRAEKHWEKAAFNTATVLAIFGIGVSTMGLTQLALGRNSKLH